MNRRIKLLLLVSIVLNAGLVGIFIGQMSHHLLWSHNAHHFPGERLAELPENKRKLFEDTMHSSRHDTQSLRDQADTAQKEASRLLAAEPFNEEAFITQMQHVSDLRAEMKRHMAESMASLAKQFTPQERAILADIVSHPPEGHHGDEGHHGEDGDKHMPLIGGSGILK